MSRRLGCGAEGDAQAGQVDRPPRLPGDMVDQRAHHLKGSKDLPANLFGRTHASTDTRMPRSAYQATMG
jgi:hypothetical protein